MSACSLQTQKTKTQRTSSARATYGNSIVELKSHVKSNRKSKRKAIKEANRDKPRFERMPYRRGMPI
jgi:hypothetical protein